MPWQEVSRMHLRQEFVTLAQQEGSNLRALCQRFGISRKTGYKWLARVQEAGVAGLGDRSHRPHRSPSRTPAAVEAQVLALRQLHPTWGGRKLHHALRQQGVAAVPAPSTITAILHRHAQLPPRTATEPALQRFEHTQPNDLWQLDFMGHLALDHGRVHPLALLDDHARYALLLAACPNEQQPTVQAQLTACFQRYGLPQRLLTDNGPPWGTSGAGGLTTLDVWLIRLGIRLIHGRAYHPQTQGKIERFHRTIAVEAIGSRRLTTLTACQALFDTFRHHYNHERPHAALDYAVPASRYQPSPRDFPATLPPLEYAVDDQVRLVKAHGVIVFHNRRFFVGRGLAHQPVALRPTTTDGVFGVYFSHHQVTTIDLTDRHTDQQGV